MQAPPAMLGSSSRIRFVSRAHNQPPPISISPASRSTSPPSPSGNTPPLTVFQQVYDVSAWNQHPGGNVIFTNAGEDGCFPFSTPPFACFPFSPSLTLRSTIRIHTALPTHSWLHSLSLFHTPHGGQPAAPQALRLALALPPLRS